MRGSSGDSRRVATEQSARGGRVTRFVIALVFGSGIQLTAEFSQEIIPADRVGRRARTRKPPGGPHPDALIGECAAAEQALVSHGVGCLAGPHQVAMRLHRRFDCLGAAMGAVSVYVVCAHRVIKWLCSDENLSAKKSVSQKRPPDSAIGQIPPPRRADELPRKPARLKDEIHARCIVEFAVLRGTESATSALVYTQRQ